MYVVIIWFFIESELYMKIIFFFLKLIIVDQIFYLIMGGYIVGFDGVYFFGFSLNSKERQDF